MTSGRSRILLTNDDGVDSPALVPFARALADTHDVAVAVPDGERSWIGKAISRHVPITLDTVERGGVVVHTTSGTPADAVQLGVHHVGSAQPDVVVSGINLGFNHGTAFMLSSGTVGAAIEGWLLGRPAVAFSTGTWGDDWAAWRRMVEAPDAASAWDSLARFCRDLLDHVIGSGVFEVADIVSVNVPFEASATTPRRVTRLARVGYGSLYASGADGRFEHRRVDYVPLEDLAGTDVSAAPDHAVTITPIRLPTTPDVPDDVRSRLEGGSSFDPVVQRRRDPTAGHGEVSRSSTFPARPT